MNLREAGQLLIKAQAYDNRTIGEMNIQAWAEALAEVDYTMALDAVTTHYFSTAEWIGPSHIRRHVREVELQRMRDVGPPNYPSGLTQVQERAYRLLWLDAVKRGRSADEATAAADAELGYEHGPLVGPSPDVRKAIEDFKLKDPNDPKPKPEKRTESEGDE